MYKITITFKTKKELNNFVKRNSFPVITKKPDYVKLREGVIR